MKTSHRTAPTPRAETPANRGEKLPNVPLSETELTALFRAARGGGGKNSVRNLALLALGYHAGLRCSEAISLRVGDINMQKRELVVARGKGGRSRIVAMNEPLAAALGAWIETRRKLGIRTHALLTTCEAREEGFRALSASQVRATLTRLGKRAQLERRVNFHALRASMASDWMRRGATLEAIRSQLGHRSLATTSVYVGRITAQHLLDTCDQVAFDPLG